MTWTIDERGWTDPAGAALRLAQRAELDERYGCDDHEPGGAPSASDIDLFLVAFDDNVAFDENVASGDGVGADDNVASGDRVALDKAESGVAVGCGALRRLGEHSAEVKRMYVAPGSRGSGVAAAILRALEAAAVRRGWTTLRLETGTAQPDAIRFYQREGYREIPLYGVYAGSEISRCFEKSL
ncbi:GNAT family N-acetyltransferase [Actinoplanes palleronii]|uniref:N-acetyltransferase n=1 Tax=Actinoplanes palleronii TaxID=113570 RepID=A0ABQ4B3F7_9ACTN|nr:GNAT family N-acetyltransferase [Actinoplanes palleronii]GIE65199.1 N-acetyltransferase [Actinoplanes palleronii]